MEGYFSTGNSPQWAVVPMEGGGGGEGEGEEGERKEEEEEEGEEEEDGEIWWQIGKIGRIFFDRPKPTASCSVKEGEGRRERKSGRRRKRGKG
jgi:hypothetical protein